MWLMSSIFRLHYKMIDVSQWRASIGLWNYCQAASSRPANGHQCNSFKKANGRQCHSFKDAVYSKSGSITSVEKTTKLLPIIALLFLLYIFFPLSRIDYAPPTGKPLLYTLYNNIVNRYYYSLLLVSSTVQY